MWKFENGLIEEDYSGTDFQPLADENATESYKSALAELIKNKQSM